MGEERTVELRFNAFYWTKAASSISSSYRTSNVLLSSKNLKIKFYIYFFIFFVFLAKGLSLMDKENSSLKSIPAYGCCFSLTFVLLKSLSSLIEWDERTI